MGAREMAKMAQEAITMIDMLKELLPSISVILAGMCIVLLSYVSYLFIANPDEFYHYFMHNVKMQAAFIMFMLSCLLNCILWLTK